MAGRRHPLSPRDSEHAGQRRGFRVDQTVPGGPAAHAGIRAGDVVLAIDGQSTTDVRALQRRLLAIRLGDPVTLRV